MEFTPRYEVAKARDGKWGVYFRLDERTSFDQRVYYRTRREAVATCFALNADHAEYVRSAKQRKD